MKINHITLFAHALRSALLVFAGVIVYKIITEIDIEIYKIYKIHDNQNVYIKEGIKFISILIIDLIIIYSFIYIFGKHAPF
jgi:hypothetical protein